VAVAAILTLGLAAGIGGTAGVLAYGSSCDLDSLRSVRIGQNTFLYAADGSLLGSIPAERNRQPVTAEGMSLWIRKATIAVEDRRFFAHGGVDIEGIARAAVADIRAGEIVEGGSTITQQLVRNLYISRERTVQTRRGLDVPLSEAECYCPGCRRAFFPSVETAGSGRGL
jgi:penicillin-binding protein 1A